jgi:hypothetical protein
MWRKRGVALTNAAVFLAMPATSSSVSIIGIASTIVCLLALGFHFLVIPSRKRNALNKVCCYITFADLCSSCGLIFGFTRDGTSLCQAQAFLTNIGPLWSIFWTLRGAVIVLEIIHRHQTNNSQNIATTPSSSSMTSHLSSPLSASAAVSNQRQATFETSYLWHIFCWVWPLVLTLLILTTNRYGCGEKADICWCFIANRQNSPEWSLAFWTITAFYLWVWLSIVIFTIVFLLALHHCRQYRTASSCSSSVTIDEVIIRTLLPYLLILIVCWIGPTIFDGAVAINPNSRVVTNPLSVFISSTLPTLQGLLTGIIFIRSTMRQWVSQLKVHPATVLPALESNRQLACAHNRNIDEMVSYS